MPRVLLKQTKPKSQQKEKQQEQRSLKSKTQQRPGPTRNVGRKIRQPKVTDALTRTADCYYILERNLPCNSNNRNAFWAAYIQFYSK